MATLIDATYRCDDFFMYEFIWLRTAVVSRTRTLFVGKSLLLSLARIPTPSTLLAIAPIPTLSSPRFEKRSSWHRS